MDVRIYRPAKNAMQSGQGNTKSWVLEFEPSAPRVIDPLMGWWGSSDTRRQVKLRFPDKKAAIAFAKKHGLDYQVFEPEKRVIRPKSYADNFRPGRVA